MKSFTLQEEHSLRYVAGVRHLQRAIAELEQASDEFAIIGADFCHEPIDRYWESLLKTLNWILSEDLPNRHDLLLDQIKEKLRIKD